MQGLKESENVEHGKFNLIMGNRRNSYVTVIGTYGLMFHSVRLDLDNCCYLLEMARYIIYFHYLFRQRISL